jgi:hypothetical protein
MWSRRGRKRKLRRRKNNVTFHAVCVPEFFRKGLYAF